MIMPGTVSRTSPGRITGRAPTCTAVTAPWLAADAIPTRFSAGFATSAMFRNVAGPGTTTSARSDNVMTTLAMTDPPGGTGTVRLRTVKIINRYVSSADPDGT